jgi:hypothetical protein
MTETPTPPRRRWFQFSLREIFWLTLVIALMLFGTFEHLRRKQGDAEINQMKETRRKLESELRDTKIQVHAGERIKL